MTAAQVPFFGPRAALVTVDPRGDVHPSCIPRLPVGSPPQVFGARLARSIGVTACGRHTRDTRWTRRRRRRVGECQNDARGARRARARSTSPSRSSTSASPARASPASARRPALRRTGRGRVRGRPGALEPCEVDVGRRIGGVSVQGPLERRARLGRTALAGPRGAQQVVGARQRAVTARGLEGPGGGRLEVARRNARRPPKYAVSGRAGNRAVSSATASSSAATWPASAATAASCSHVRGSAGAAATASRARAAAASNAPVAAATRDRPTRTAASCASSCARRSSRRRASSVRPARAAASSRPPTAA